MATTDSGIPVLSFPAILRNPGLNHRFAHLNSTASGGGERKQQTVKTTTKKNHRDQNEGKRWIRRKDNARFVGNPHIVMASKRDYLLVPPQAQSTFPHPLPPYLPRSVKLPTTPTLPVTDPGSANAGRFSLSLKGMRRDLRRAGGRAEALVKDVESEMVQWLTLGGTVFAPDIASHEGGRQTVGTPVGTTGTILEVSRTPLQLVWQITDDAFARYVVHCCARYHEIVSFSKGASDSRLTYLLRPNVTRPDRRAPAGLETPPVTDIDYSSNPETDGNIDSDFISDSDLESDVELSHNNTLAAIDESPNPALSTLPPLSEDEWSHIDGENAGESDFDEFDSGSEAASALSASIDVLQPRLEALSLESPLSAPIFESQILPAASPTAQAHAEYDPDRTVTEIMPNLIHDAPSPRRREWTSSLSGRSTSSPSRSPFVDGKQFL
ncbi:hypothetical protein M413DRAFT_24614 [Hebeloma cylindrosporum]|uniref:Uncharacterized protein n=1 Tax=Hebeloma cylindrosporum TaxID=76867 RepID=A0A0C2Y6B2_HEBCY|nr:hypothetical protein M413DRAFT_24614 [Hebeloma cylindrosporum h7]